MPEDKESGYRAKIILLKDEGHSVPEIRKMTDHHDNNIIIRVHRFNQQEVTDGVMSKKCIHKQHKITDI